ncbi:T9SS type A sorting domain-containing protein [Seonamhaeicola algicola]|uniref:T9SS type A sorting domain-containing protein n=2 Tax=Seonamhaeicola TaxID=1649495 RepID=A0A5C7AUC3_9FLAO|nr:T9SS type A sorting domain-containing protein [Seonamhaeicola algicola]TXE11991.1 T9SS type A sorting domain-containing protein [Seonamhaeicola algicola]
MTPNLKKSLPFLITLFLPLFGYVYAQNNDFACGTSFSEAQIELFNSIKHNETLSNLEANKHLNLKDLSENIVNYIPVKIHILRYSNGSDGLCDADLNTAIDNLNNHFNNARMTFFVSSEVNYIDNNQTAHITKGKDDTVFETNNTPGVINIYFTHALKNEANLSICGYTNNTRNKDYLVIKNSCATTSLVHEMGHFFSLLHTHGNDNNALTTELVDGSNCDTDGDGICDTPADPKLTTTNVNEFCEYIGIETDAHGHTFKPDVSNIMSYAKKNCRTHFSKQQLQRMYAFYITQKHYLSSTNFNADVVASNTITCQNKLTVNFSNSCPNASAWEWDINSDGVIDYTSQNPSHTFNSGMYSVTLSVYKNSKKITKTYHNLVKVGVLTETLFDESFDTFNIAGDDGWTVNDNNSGYHWVINHGETHSDATGPIHNHHHENGDLNRYIYTEASGAEEGAITEFISPCIDVVHQNSEIDFNYHMFGENIGELHVDIKTNNGYKNDVIPPFIGSQQNNQADDFLTASINLSYYAGETINIRFRAVRGNGWKGDIAIDNVHLKTISVPVTDKDIKLYPNPVKNNLLYIQTLASNFNDDSTVLHFEISNLVGQKFSSGIVTNKPIDTSNLASGSYLLTVISNTNRVVKRFIK